MQKALLKHGGTQEPNRCALVLESVVVSARDPVEKVHQHARIQRDEPFMSPRRASEYPHALMSHRAPPQKTVHHHSVQPIQRTQRCHLDSIPLVVRLQVGVSRQERIGQVLEPRRLLVAEFA